MAFQRRDIRHGLLLRYWAVLCFLALLRTAALPPGFEEREIATNLIGATCLAALPDQRILVGTQDGSIRVVSAQGVLLAKAFAVLPALRTGQMGLSSLVPDPAFGSNRRLYALITLNDGGPRTCVIKLQASTLDPNVSDGTTEFVYRGTTLKSTARTGGSLAFDGTGRLLVALGDDSTPADVLSPLSTAGKVLRMTTTGGVPTDNPFPVGPNITSFTFAKGFRQPGRIGFSTDFRTALLPDRGQTNWEELNLLASGGEFGWPSVEGPASKPNPPIWTYGRSICPGSGNAVVGGGFLPKTGGVVWPEPFRGNYLFGDATAGWIRCFVAEESGYIEDLRAADPAFPIQDLLVTANSIVYCLVGPTGSSSRRLVRLRYTQSEIPTIVTSPVSLNLRVGQTATFSVSARSDFPLIYQWLRDDEEIPGASSPLLTYKNVTAADDQAVFRCLVGNQHATVSSGPATLSVTFEPPPNVFMLSPVEGSQLNAGQILSFSGYSVDPQSGPVSPSAMKWNLWIDHGTGEPELAFTRQGVTNGTWAVPSTPSFASAHSLTLEMEATNSRGGIGVLRRLISLRQSKLSVDTLPTGLELEIAGTTMRTPFETPSVVGVLWPIRILSPQRQGNTVYVYSHWSDGGTSNRLYSVPPLDRKITASYQRPSAGGGGLIVDWGGNLAQEATSLRIGTAAPSAIVIDLDDDGEPDESRFELPFSLLEPLSPQTGYNQDDVSARFYGALQIDLPATNLSEVSFGVTPGVGEGGTDRLGYRFEGSGRGRWLCLWLKSDFIDAGQDRQRVRLGPGSRVQLLQFSGENNPPAPNFGQVRLVIRNSTTYYISEFLMGGSRLSSSATVDNPQNTRWARYTPSAIQFQPFDPANATWEQVVLDDVTAVGFLHDTVPDPLGITRRSNGFTVNRFRVAAVIVDRTPVQLWLEHAFDDIADPDAAYAADPDQDGVSNLFEYAMDTPPHSPNSFEKLQIALEGVPGEGKRTFWLPPLVRRAGISIAIETSSNMLDWEEWATALENEPFVFHSDDAIEERTGDVVRIESPWREDDQHRFVRLRLTPLP